MSHSKRDLETLPLIMMLLCVKDNLQKFVPSLGGQMMDVGGHLIGGHMSGQAGGAGHAPVPPPKPGSYGKGLGGGLQAGGLARVAGGAGGKDGVSGDPSQSE